MKCTHEEHFSRKFKIRPSYRHVRHAISSSLFSRSSSIRRLPLLPPYKMEDANESELLLLLLRLLFTSSATIFLLHAGLIPAIFICFPKASLSTWETTNWMVMDINIASTIIRKKMLSVNFHSNESNARYAAALQSPKFCQFLLNLLLVSARGSRAWDDDALAAGWGLWPHHACKGYGANALVLEAGHNNATGLTRVTFFGRYVVTRPRSRCERWGTEIKHSLGLACFVLKMWRLS